MNLSTTIVFVCLLIYLFVCSFIFNTIHSRKSGLWHWFPLEIRPHVFHALFVVSRIIIVCYIIRHCWKKTCVRQVVVDNNTTTTTNNNNNTNTTTNDNHNNHYYDKHDNDNENDSTAATTTTTTNNNNYDNNIIIIRKKTCVRQVAVDKQAPPAFTFVCSTRPDRPLEMIGRASIDR